jgi:hypothetical protein
MFHIGEMHAVLGSAYTCADPTLWQNNFQNSGSGLSNVKNTLRYSYLVNTDGNYHRYLSSFSCIKQSLILSNYIS